MWHPQRHLIWLVSPSNHTMKGKRNFERKSPENTAQYAPVFSMIHFSLSWKQARRVQRNNSAIHCSYASRRVNDAKTSFLVRNCLGNVASYATIHHATTLQYKSRTDTVLSSNCLRNWSLKVAPIMQQSTLQVEGCDGQLHGYRNVNPSKWLILINNSWGRSHRYSATINPIRWLIFTNNCCWGRSHQYSATINPIRSLTLTL